MTDALDRRQATDPDPADIEEEIAGTKNILDGLRALAGRRR